MWFKLVNGRNDAATFFPLTIKGGPCSSSNSKCVNNHSTENNNSFDEDIVKTTYSRANAGNETNHHTTQKEIMKVLEVNSYKEVMLKEGNKNKDQVPMEEWSILSDHVKYVMQGKSEVFQRLSINSINYRQNRDLYKSLNNEEAIKTSFNFGNSPENLKAEYLDMYKGIYVEVISTDKFDEDTDIRTTYPVQKVILHKWDTQTTW